MIPEKTDQQANRKSRGSKGGRPVVFDAEAYWGRNVARVMRPRQIRACLS